jgi:hypothetical protein
MSTAIKHRQANPEQYKMKREATAVPVALPGWIFAGTEKEKNPQAVSLRAKKGHHLVSIHFGDGRTSLSH